MLAQGKTQAEVAKKFKVSRSNISEIATGRAWAKVEGPAKVNTRKTAVKDYNPTDERVLQLEAEVACLRQERGLVKRQYEATKKEHGLFNAVASEMSKYIVPLKATKPPKVSSKGKITESLVLMLSDGHHDQVVDPESVGGLEAHDLHTAARRAERYIDTVLNYTKGVLGSAYNYPEVYVLSLGDSTSGLIHNAVERSHFRNQFKNSLVIGQIHALMVKELAEHFPKVHFVSVSGNHGRMTHSKEYTGPTNNWDYLIAEMVRQHCVEIKNVDFTIPNSFSVNLAINGVGFNLAHGDDIKSSMGIPYYGIERRTRRLQAMTQAAGIPPIRYHLMGHFHRASSLGDLNGEVLINGPWVACDPYSYNAFSGFSLPTQWMFSVHPNHGITWRLGVHPRNENQFLERPTRYKIPMLEAACI